MKHQNLSALAQSGQATPVLGEAQRFEAVIEAFKARKGQSFYLFHDLERIEGDNLRKFKITPTDVFGTMASAIGLNSNRLGDLMDALPLSETDVHLFGCDCHQPGGDPQVDGMLIALMLMSRKLHLGGHTVCWH